MFFLAKEALSGSKQEPGSLEFYIKFIINEVEFIQDFTFKYALLSALGMEKENLDKFKKIFIPEEDNKKQNGEELIKLFEKLTGAGNE